MAGILVGALRGVPAEGVAENRRFEARGRPSPPYFLSNGEISVQSGKQVSVNKGDWDKSQGFEKDNEFNYQWLKLCREKLKENGTIWISGTYHNIFPLLKC